eukprot:COSAG01_NODE_1132_length_11565_cov_84.210412_13_plen_65_part_00
MRPRDSFAGRRAWGGGAVLWGVGGINSTSPAVRLRAERLRCAATRLPTREGNQARAATEPPPPS